jgi:hypothetical protein
MSAPFGGGFPGAAPGAPQQTAGTFVLNVQADPSWEPFQSTDVLEKDGYYCGRIVKESARNDQNKAAGVFFEFQLQDADAAGKRLMKFVSDPNTSKGNTWWIWRSLMRSITGDTAHGKAGFQYAVGAWANQLVYFKTEAYLDDGAMRTGVGDFITKAEYDAQVASGRHRWAAKSPSPTAGAGALPGGLPSSFPGMGLPAGGPSAPMPMAPQGAPAFPPPTTPQPMAAPMQPAFASPPAQQPTFAPAPSFAPAPAPGFAAPAPAFAPPAAAVPPPPFAPPNGVTPQPPTAAMLAGGFPGMPPQQR